MYGKNNIKKNDIKFNSVVCYLLQTDDQILLLQNCWAELLCLTSCWNSIGGDNEIRLSHGRSLTLDKADSMGLKEVTQRMLDITAAFRSLAIDQHEMVAVKVLLLLSPGEVQGMLFVSPLHD